jgi:hypothetical protein
MIDDIVELVDRLAPGATIEIVGDGAIATGLRRRRSSVHTGRPAAVVAADLSVLADAMRSVADRGLVVVCVAPGAEDLDLDVYEDLHVRGLTLVPVLQVSE